ncbi:hypothetical protein Q5H93_14755 [Hymenobacter sp. ASUV-10]|uniref:DUF3102 domain-containing protein n=1 Tax=Hymenobacter aranciens TaxID=3063996 RepID=A0ABT9BCK1_9BACT|nr:hypothetical protein [Hymenobacter sp. ASUV-10]MDO7876001.1 hypothetical protein [Hymenobacter sp. ASUV-10]
MEENPNYNKSTETALDRIRASFFDDEEDSGLSTSDLEQKGQLVATHAWLTQGKSVEKTVVLLCARYTIGRATAYRRIRDTTALFGEVTRTHKEGVKHILYEMAMGVFRKAMKAQDKFGNPDLKAANAAIKNMAILKGLDKEDSTALTPEVLGNKTYVLQISLNGADGKPKTVQLDKLDDMDAATYAELVETVERSDVSLDGMRHLLLEAQEAEENDDDDESTED